MFKVIGKNFERHYPDLKSIEFLSGEVVCNSIHNDIAKAIEELGKVPVVVMPANPDDSTFPEDRR